MIVHDVSEYVHQPVPHIPHIVQNLLIRKGSMIIYGTPGVKKSWLVEHLAFCLATGEPWLDFNVVQSRTLIANFDDPSENYHERLVSMSAHFEVEPNMFFETSPGMLFLDQGRNMERFKETIAPYEPEVIILDCLQSCYAGSEVDKEQLSPFLLNVFQMQEELNAAIIFIHHANKNPLVTSAMDKLRGATNLPAWFDTVIYMTELPSGAQLQFAKHKRSSIDLRAKNIVFENYLWRLR